MQVHAELGEVLVSVGGHHPEDTQDDGHRHIALGHPAYAARHTNWENPMEGNAVANPCQANAPARSLLAFRARQMSDRVLESSGLVPSTPQKTVCDHGGHP
jgi:hypothetical protein